MHNDPLILTVANFGHGLILIVLKGILTKSANGTDTVF